MHALCNCILYGQPLSGSYSIYISIILRIKPASILPVDISSVYSIVPPVSCSLSHPCTLQVIAALYLVTWPIYICPDRHPAIWWSNIATWSISWLMICTIFVRRRRSLLNSFNWFRVLVWTWFVRSSVLKVNRSREHVTSYSIIYCRTAFIPDDRILWKLPPTTVRSERASIKYRIPSVVTGL